MREVTVSTVISAPREEVFDFVCDLAARPAYTDHFMDDYRLARVKPVGVGAAARFRLNAPMSNEYAELTITEADRPRRIVEEIRVGRRGRSRSVAVYDFTRESAGVTRVELTTFSEPATRRRPFPRDRRRRVDSAQDAQIARPPRTIFEEPQKEPPKRVTIAGFEAEKAARFGVHAGMDPARPSEP